MKNLYEVTFDAKYTHCGDPLEETVKVIANGDGMKAVAKAKRLLLGREFEDGPRGKSGKYVTCRCVSAKLTGLELLHSIDA